MTKSIFRTGLISSGIFGLCVAAVYFGGGVGPCGGSMLALMGLILAMFAGPIAAGMLVISSPVLLYRHLLVRAE